MSGAALRLEGQGLRYAEFAVVGTIVCMIGLLVLPLPPAALDLLLALSIGLSVLVLLVALYTADPLEFSIFPTLLLLLTLYRLALNVSSTRLILGDADAGRVIESFGAFVIGGNYAVGVVIFLILIAVNFIVITKGAGRVAEVAARFTLDAMPGRQMSIDADLNAGLIDETEARRRRDEISREADFYGAMDGSAKFVRGDAIAGLLITAINIVGGIFIGVVQRGLPMSRAAAEYTILTVGDGLVSQIPALIVSTAAGIIVTHSAEGARVGSALISQIGRDPRAVWICSIFLVALGLVPGLPTLPFLFMAGAVAVAAQVAAKHARQRIPEEAPAPEPEPEESGSHVRDLLQLDPLELELGYGLIGLVEQGADDSLLDRVRLLRRQAAVDLGVLIPPIRIRDNIRLDPNEYLIKLRGGEIARGEVMPRLLLALDTGAVTSPVDGLETTDPSFGLPGRWIQGDDRPEAEASGYVVVEATTVVTTHLMEALKSHAADLLGRQDVQELVDALKQTYPALVDDVIPGKISIGVLHRVLQRLLRERVPIRDLVTILEVIADVADQVKDPEVLCEHVRRALGSVIAEQYADERGTIRGVTLGPRLEAGLMNFFNPRTANASGMLDAGTLTELLRDLDALTRPPGAETQALPLITPPGLRVGVRRLIEPVLPAVPVISLAELPPKINLETVKVWEMTHER